MKIIGRLPVVLMIVHIFFPAAFGQGTAFFYQGRLNENEAPAFGSYELQFTLYSAETGGSVVGGPVTNAAVFVSNGLFQASLDFGPAVFDGAPRWLEIGVRTNGSTVRFTILVPRQLLAPTPYALFSASAGTVPSGAITAGKLAPGAAVANLQASGQSAVPSGGVVLSEQANATELLAAGYLKLGRAEIGEESWERGLSGPPAARPGVLARRGHSAVWTGSELIIWGGIDENDMPLRTGSRYNPATGVWTPLNTNNAPAGRVNHSAVWTGSEMIVWGGMVYGFFGGTVTNTGAKYNLATDTWTAIAAGGGSRQNHSAYWTGTEMLIWGGSYISSGTFGGSTVPTSSGSRYNPAANTWTAMTSTGAPTARFGYSAVFTGTELIIWGGWDSYGSFITTKTNFNDGARYSVSANTWTPVQTAGAPTRRYGHSAVWTGTEMIVWGGTYSEGSLSLVTSNYNNGARYNPSANTWSAMAMLGGPAARFDHDAVWAGNRMLVWGGTDGTNLFGTGARYYPALNTWSNMTFAGRPLPRTGHTATWIGNEMMIWGGYNNMTLDIGGRYNPANDQWTPTNPTGERSKRNAHTAIWTGSEMLIWGGFDGERHLNSGGRYDPSTKTWAAISTNNAPAARANHSAVWTGTEMIVWGGVGPDYLNSGGRYNPATDTWLTTPTANAPTARNGHAAVWTGKEMVIWGGLDGQFVNTGGRYDPVANTWVSTSAANAPAVRTGARAVWTGSEMIVWGGVGGVLGTPMMLASGGRYNPRVNSWTALPTANAPAARSGYQSVWTGEEMLIWGGNNLTTELGSGGRYHLAANTWTSISTNLAPSSRTGHTAVWDGTRMIVWGGSAGETFLRTGGIYNPVTDIWLATAAGTNSAPGRVSHVAVWTGAEMIVHGGWHSPAPETMQYLDDTWHYAPPRTLFLYLKR